MASVDSSSTSRGPGVTVLTPLLPVWMLCVQSPGGVPHLLLGRPWVQMQAAGHVRVPGVSGLQPQ